MNEHDAQRWLAQLGVPRETLDKLERFAALLASEDGQNLISGTTRSHVLARHIVDSAQLLRFIPSTARTLLDLGSGAGLPGLVLAMIAPIDVVLVESRRLRVDWLQSMIRRLALNRVSVLASRIEHVPEFKADVITARAFAPLIRLLPLAETFATGDTVWLLPKGRSAAEELASVATTWHGRFRMEASLTDPDSAIIVADGVRRACPSRAPRRSGAQRSAR